MLLAGMATAVVPALPAMAQAPAPGAAPAPVAAAATEDLLSQAQLEQLLAPIALYPDELLMQLLIAATYPLEVVMAYRWLREGQNADLQGEALVRALEAQSWDPSVKSLVPFPDVLAMMNEQLEWTQQVGDALLAQQADVLNAVQVLRGRAHAAGHLQSGPQQTVTVTQNAVAVPASDAAPVVVAPPPQVIVIAPAQPERVYVPVYNPTVVFGTWPHPTYPPVYHPPPPAYGLGTALLTGMAFAAGVAVVGSLWGWGRPGWNSGSVNVNVNRFNNINVNRTQINNNVWRHNASHRHGVAYNNNRVRNEFRRADVPGRDVGRDDLRGRFDSSQPGAGGRLDIGGSRPGAGAGNRPGVGDRPGAGAINRPGSGDRPGAGPATRPGAGDRPAAGAANRPGGGDRPGAGTRPATPDRPGAAAQRPATRQSPSGRPQVQSPPQRGAAASPRPTALQGAGSGAADRAAAARGQASRQSAQARPAAQRGGDGGGGGGGLGRR
jgi:hypothetical protein